MFGLSLNQNTLQKFRVFLCVIFLDNILGSGVIQDSESGLNQAEKALGSNLWNSNQGEEQEETEEQKESISNIGALILKGSKER